MSEIDKSKSPYFDDFKADKKYHEVLFRPRRAVQTRELNQIQSMFNEQIKRLGEHTFEDGSVVIPGETNYDLELSYVTLNITNYSNVVGLLGSPNIELVGSNGITAKAKLFRETEGSDPATFYVEYGSSSDDQTSTVFPDGTNVEIVLNNQTIAVSTVLSTGVASKFTINNGVYYISGRFVLVEEQTVLLDKYSNAPSKVVGIEYNEVAITESEDNTLFDNAQGTPNFSAPGAHRLRVDTNLKVFDLSETDSIPDNIVEIFRIEDGEIQKTYRGPEYNILGDVLAQRTYEESGDYTVKSFNIGFESYDTVYDSVDDTKFAIQLDPGIGYVRGYRVETISKTNIVANKARETGVINNSSISAALGYYVEVENLSTLPSLTDLQSIQFRDASNSVIGTARLRFIFEASTNVYRLYIFDVRNSAGDRSTAFISNATSIDSNDTVSFTADIIDSVIQEASYNSLIFPMNVDFVRTLENAGQSDTSYSTVKQVSGSLDTNGSITITAGGFENFIAQDSRYAVGVYTDNNTFLDIANSYTLGGSPLGSIITLNFGSANSGRPVRLNLQVAKEQVVQKTKTPQTTTVTGTLSNGELALDVADAYELVSVKDNSNNDVTSLFTLNHNKRKSFYDISTVSTDSVFADPITVEFKYFSHSSGDYFGPDSYVGVGYEDIPVEDGQRLSDVLDFRPRIANSGTSFSGTGSSVGNIPTPFTVVRTDIEHYLSRIDKVYLKSNGEFGVVEGVPALDPKEPSDPADSMILYVLEVPAYTFSLEDVQAEKMNNRRYTMRDIGTIENRLSNVEYYVTLNNLEQEADSNQVLDPVTGANRFKNGFLTDQFIDHSVGDFAWEQYHISVDDEGTLRPEFSLNAIDIEYDATESIGVVNNNGIVTLPYQEVSFVKQDKRSRSINVNPYAIYRWSGQLKLEPSVDSWIDTVYANPEVTYRVFNNGRLTQSWNSWQLNWTGGTSRSSRTRSSWSRSTTTTTTTRTNVDVVNDRIIDTSVIPYMRSIEVDIEGTGNRPESRMNFFFDNTKINQYVKPQGGNYGQFVVTDNDGNFQATFRIPNNQQQRFRTGEKQIIATDEENNQRELSTSYAQSLFSSTGNRNVRRQTIVATRSVQTSTSSRRIRWSDPLAQSFLVERNGGVFVTKINAFFETKDARVPVSVQLREMENGVPTQRIVPGGEAMLLPDQVNTSNDGSVATTFDFPHPVYLQDGNEYCFVLTSNSNAYNAFIATMGEEDIRTGRFIVRQPYAGVLFKSQNNSTWTEDQQSDLQFEIFCAKFETNTNGIMVANNKQLDNIRLELNPIRTQENSGVLTITRKDHNYAQGTIIQLSGVVPANAIVGSEVNDVNLTVESVIDPDTFTVEVATIADTTGDIGGTDVEISNTIQASLLNPNIPTIDLPNTTMTFEARGTDGMSIDGTETPYVIQSAFVPVSNNKVNNLTQPWIITNRNDENFNVSNQRTFKIRSNMSTSNENVSPVIDMTGATIITPMYQITNKVSVEADASNNWANYRTQVSSLQQPADMMKVMLDVKRQEGSNVVVTARVGNSEEEVNESSWFEIPNVSGEAVTSDNQYYENEFELTGITPFTQYQLMIQLKSASAAIVPECKRLRVLALSDFS